jgi:hypothetical protein
LFSSYRFLFFIFFLRKNSFPNYTPLRIGVPLWLWIKEK